MRRSAEQSPTPSAEGLDEIPHEAPDEAPQEAPHEGGPARQREGQGWTLLTSHGRVLLLIARDPGLRLRDIAEQARITERSAAGIVSDLEEAGYLTKLRAGRRNRYVIHDELAFRHPAEADHQVRELIEIFRHH